jgi:AraC-like DNA-binding protein
MAESFFSTIILIGAVHGLVMSAFLFSLRENKVPACALAWLLLLISIASLNIWSWSIRSWQHTLVYNLVTQCLPLVVIMPVGPLIWLYVRSVLDPTLRIGKKEKLHFMAVIIDLIAPLTNILYLIVVLLMGKKQYGPSLTWFVDGYNVYSDIPRWISITWYCWMSFQLLRPNTAAITIERHADHIRWLRQFLLVFMGFLAIWLCQLIPYVIPKYTDWVLDNIGWYPVYVPLTILVYVLGTKGYLQVKQIRLVPIKETTSIFTQQQIAETMTTLERAMVNDKLFLDAALNLATVSRHTHIPAKQISAVLNQHATKSFNEFINEYRVKEVIRRLSLPGSENLTLAGLGFECGFNSQPTFQRAFKSVTGKTPSQYQASLRPELKQY